MMNEPSRPSYRDRRLLHPVKARLRSAGRSMARPLVWVGRFAWKWLKRTNLSLWILISVIVGILLGQFAPDFSRDIKPLADVFLAMIKCLIVPLIFSTLVVGIAGHGDDLKSVGRIAIKALIYFEVVTTLALVVGLVFVNIIQPGKGVDLDGVSAEQGQNLSSHHMTLDSELKKIVPESFFHAAADNQVLQIVFCALIFAIAMITMPAPRRHQHPGGSDTMADLELRRPVLEFLDNLSNIMFRVTAIVMLYAPIGIGAALAATIGTNGLKILVNLGKLVGCLYAALVCFIVIVLLPIALLARIPLLPFCRAVARPFILAFTTASSEAALPIAMENLELLGVPKKIIAFVLPTGYSFNLDGTTLYLSLAGVFAAQAGNVDFPLKKQIMMMLTLILSSKGVAAVPRASLVVLSGALANFGLPMEAVAVIIGVDAFMDMARTSVNVLGNCLSAVVIARWEGVYPPPIATAVDDAATTASEKLV